MPTETQNLNLFKYDPVQDAKSTFNIQQSLNDNWDKIDNIIPVKANTSLDNLTDEGIEKFFSDWVNIEHVTIFSRNFGTSTNLIEYTLDFLPDDSAYELLLYAYMTSVDTSKALSGSVNASSDIITTPMSLVHVGAPSYFACGNTCSFFVKNKKIYTSDKSYYSNGKGNLNCLAYRKIGTGFTITQSEATQDE